MVKNNRNRNGSRFYGKLDDDTLSDWQSYIESKDTQFLKELIEQNSAVLGKYAKAVEYELLRRKRKEKKDGN